MIPHKWYSWKVYEPGDLSLIDPLGVEGDMFQSLEGYLEKLAALHNGDSRFCGTAFIDTYSGGERIARQAFAVGGWQELLEPGVYSGFFLLDKAAADHPRIFVRTFRAWCRHIVRLPGFKVLQTYSIPEPRIDRAMVALGFVYKETVREYANGHDYSLWERVA